MCVLGDEGECSGAEELDVVRAVAEDAHPAALALADVVIAPPERGGWAQVLDLL